jgi:hypothetical protein
MVWLSVVHSFLFLGYLDTAVPVEFQGGFGQVMRTALISKALQSWSPGGTTSTLQEPIPLGWVPGSTEINKWVFLGWFLSAEA